MQIRHAQKGDELPLAHLLEEHERHYGNPIERGTGGPGAAFLVSPSHGGPFCLVAENEGRLVGFAVLNPYFPGPNLTHGLFLKELYVAAHARSDGIGERLFEAIRTEAEQRGCTRVIWTTGEENSGAQRFYDKLGIKREGKINYVMDL